MIGGPPACGREQPIRARDPNDRFGMARVCAVAAHTSSPLPDLRFHHGKCAQSIEGEDGKMRPTTVSPLTVSVNRQEKEDLARYRLRARHEFSPTMIWIEHDMQLVCDLADKVLVLHYDKELALGPPN